MKSRRRILQALASLPAAGFLRPLAAQGALDTAQFDQAVTEVFGPGQRVTPGRVTVSIPAISENGYSVPLGIEVDSPMTQADHVRELVVISQSNPLPVIARFQFGPRSGLAKVSTRIRLADSQRVYAVAQMNDGSLWSGYGHSIVTLAACVI